MGDDAKGNERARRALEAGADIAGSVTVAAAGFVVAGPPGAIGGAVVGPMLASGLKELAGRLLGRREEARVGAVVLAAAAAINERLEYGSSIRDDGFFSDPSAARSDGDEIIEGVRPKVGRTVRAILRIASCIRSEAAAH